MAKRTSTNEEKMIDLLEKDLINCSIVCKWCVTR